MVYLDWFSTAANMVSGDNPAYTAEDFLEDFPQLAPVPTGILTTFIAMANEAIQEARWFDSWRYGMGLFVAHYVTMYLRTYRETAGTALEAAWAGDAQGLLSGQSAAGVSESYSHSELIEATKSWGIFNATEYGRQLASLGKIYGMGPSYIM